MLDEKLNPQLFEEEILKYWEENKIFQFDSENKSKRPIFSVDTPPPTVSGKMHVGHAFGYIQHDIFIRYMRMNGYNVYFPFGTDDNGLPSEKLVEKQMKVKASKMQRNDFIKLCLKYLSENRDNFIKDWKVIGMSCDFDKNFSTIDENSRKISQNSFIELYKKGREYRKKAPTIWCPTCETAISQVELEDVELESTFNDIIFRLEDGKQIIISTTRPELLPACVGIFVHPDDERYKNLIDKYATTPIFNDKVKIMGDNKVDMTKGTGIVMCCTFGDQTDIEWYKKYNLELKTAITKNGLMTKLAQKYEGLKIKEARKEIIEDLKSQNLLISQKSIKHCVNVHERCGTEVEILESPQWFVKYLDLKEKFLEIGNELEWFPKHLKNRYDNWVNGLMWDWCISRQRFFGVPFPVWYCRDCGEIILADKKDLPVDPLSDSPKKPCPECNSTNFVPETDVMDTWATSSLSCELYKNLIDDEEIKKELDTFSLRFQGHDIISFWLFNSIAKSYLHNEKKPWHKVGINGWVLAPNGKKMAKSKGNVIDPRKYLEKYSADMMRYWASSVKIGDDTPFKENEFVSGKKTITKLWNAQKFVMMNLKDKKCKLIDHMNIENLEAHNKWIFSELNKLLKEIKTYYDNYEYNKAKMSWERFFWSCFCDNYLEMSKSYFYNEEEYSKEEIRETQNTLFSISYYINLTIAPILSFITDKIYLNCFYNDESEFKEKSIHLRQIPNYNEKIVESDDIKNSNNLIECISEVRKTKNLKQMSLKEEVEKVTICSKKNNIDYLIKFEKILKKMLKINEINFVEKDIPKIEVEFN